MIGPKLPEFPYEELYALCDAGLGDRAKACDIVMDHMMDFHFGYINIYPDIPQQYHNEILKNLDLNRLSSTLIVCFLSATLPTKDTDGRKEFAVRAREYLVASGEKEIDSLLSGLV